MDNIMDGYLTDFGSVPNLEENMEMESKRDDLCGLSQRDIHDFEESFARKIGSHKKKLNWKTTWRTR